MVLLVYHLELTSLRRTLIQFRTGFLKLQNKLVYIQSVLIVHSESIPLENITESSTRLRGYLRSS